MKFTTGRKIAFAFASFFPLLTIAAGLLLLRGGVLLTPYVLILYFLIPAAVLAVFFFLIRSCWKIWIKSLLCVAILFFYVPYMTLFAVVCPRFFLERYTGAEAMEQYAEALVAMPLLPQPDTLGDPLYQVYQHYESSAVFYLMTTNALLCDYTPEDYAAMKQALDTQWNFQTEPIPYPYRELTTQPGFTLDGFHFRFLSLEEEAYGLHFPQYVMLIGTNDNTREIVWLHWYCVDLEYIGKDVQTILLEECGWKNLLR